MPTLVVYGTAEATGTVKIAFQAAPQGFQHSGTAQVPNAVPASKWTAAAGTLGANQILGTFLGANLFGPVTVPPGQQLILIGTGLTPGVQYEGVFNMNQESAANPDATPAPYGNQTVNVQGIPGGEPVTTAAHSDLLSTKTVTVKAGINQLVAVGCLNDYAGFEVEVNGTPTGPVAVLASNLTRGTQSGISYQTLPAASPAVFRLPLSASFGDSVNISYSGVSGADWTATLTIVGAGDPFQPFPLRADGRLMPLGSLTYNAQYISASPGNQPLPATVPAAACVLLTSAIIYPSGALPGNGTYMLLGGIVDGAFTPIATAIFNSTGDWGSVADIPPQGILCDPGQAVSFQVLSDGATVLNADITYDLVF